MIVMDFFLSSSLFVNTHHSKKCFMVFLCLRLTKFEKSFKVKGAKDSERVNKNFVYTYTHE